MASQFAGGQFPGYPKYRHHAVKPARLVHTPAEESRLTPSDEGWSDTYIHQEFPKAMYHPEKTGPEKHKLVNNQAELDALGEGWYDTPAKFPKPNLTSGGTVQTTTTRTRHPLIVPLEGTDVFDREGLRNPPDVTAATEQDHLQSCQFKQFIDERCVLAPACGASSWKEGMFWVPVSDLYPAYTSWFAGTGDKNPLSKGLFNEHLQRIGRKQDRVRPDGGRHTKQVRAWLGIRLKTTEDERHRVTRTRCNGV